MLVSLKWLRDYVDIDMDTKEFADRMTMTGTKVEKVDFFDDIPANLTYPDSHALFFDTVKKAKGL